MSQGVTPQKEDFAQWYQDVVRVADLAENSPVRGCMIIKPYGYELWEAIRAALDKRFKATGHKNAYFPLFIPMSFMQKEAEHVEGFSPELAVVTIGGGEELAEPLVVRPTSETIIGHAMSNWIQSYRDLPLLLNQWANVVRWELRTRPFLRTTEFLWQEGHTAHATEAEAQAETIQMLDIYADMAYKDAAVPVIKGRKSNQEKFAGAAASYTIEGMMRNGWALQSGTSHNLGQNFAKAFDIKYVDEKNELQHAWTTSWGLSTRFVGAIIMTHGDDVGLRMPPRLAPIQVVIVPIYKTDEEKSKVLDAVGRVADSLMSVGIRLHVDERDDKSPGFKFNDWELRGVPVRMEVGPKDVEKGQVVLARRDIPGKEGKQFAKQEGIIATVHNLLNDVHNNLLKEAIEFRDSHLHDAKSLKELVEIVAAGGWALIPCDGSREGEEQIKEACKATNRCFPLDKNEGKPPKGLKDPVTGKAAIGYAYFGRSY